MAHLNLDAHRAARSEAEREPHKLTLGGRVYLIRPQMPVEFADLLVEGKLGAATKLLLLDPADWEAFRAEVPDATDLGAITETLYGSDVGESAASASFSAIGGTRSRRTSNGSTPASRASRRAATAPAPTPSASDGSPT